MGRDKGICKDCRQEPDRGIKIAHVTLGYCPHNFVGVICDEGTGNVQQFNMNETEFSALIAKRILKA
jgi:hypothetical protein